MSRNPLRPNSSQANSSMIRKNKRDAALATSHDQIRLTFLPAPRTFFLRTFLLSSFLRGLLFGSFFLGWLLRCFRGSFLFRLLGRFFLRGRLLLCGFRSAAARSGSAAAARSGSAATRSRRSRLRFVIHCRLGFDFSRCGYFGFFLFFFLFVIFVERVVESAGIAKFVSFIVTQVEGFLKKHSSSSFFRRSGAGCAFSFTEKNNAGKLKRQNLRRRAGL